MAVRVKWYGRRLNAKALYLVSLAVESTAANIWSTARQIVPVRTGRLRNSIRIERLTSRFGGMRGYVKYRIAAGAGSAVTGASGLGVRAGAGNQPFTNRVTGESEANPNAYYAVYVELGTSRMAAKPYMRPAYNKHKYQLKSTLRKIMRARL